MTVYEIYEKKTQKKPDRIVNIGKEKYKKGADGFLPSKTTCAKVLYF